MLDEMLKTIPYRKKDRRELRGFIEELMHRKELLFPDVSGMIVDFKVTDLGYDFHIAIASTVEQQE